MIPETRDGPWRTRVGPRYRDRGLSLTLDALQDLFGRAITHPTGVADFLAAADDATRAAFAASVDETAAFDRAARMSVYADAYFWRLHDVLADHFDHVAWLLGRDRFRNLATDYVLQHPSRDPDVRRFGARLPDFLATHVEATRCRGIAEIAAVEWAMVRALDVPQAPATSLASLAGVAVDAWPTMVLVPVASAWIGPAPRDFDALWRARAEGGATPLRPDAAIDASVLVWRCDRDDFAIQHRTLSDREATAWRAVIGGEPFAAWCEHAEDPSIAVQWLRAWISAGAIAGVVTAGARLGESPERS